MRWDHGLIMGGLSSQSRTKATTVPRLRLWSGLHAMMFQVAVVVHASKSNQKKKMVSLS